MKIYLDVCAIQRPLDTPNQVRIVLESEAVLGILGLCEEGQLKLISSEALAYETEQNPLPVRQEHASAILAKAKSFVKLSTEVELRAAQLVEIGFKPLDALHLSMAEAGKADYFCTCDDQILNKSKRTAGLRLKVVSPLEFIKEIEE